MSHLGFEGVPCYADMAGHYATKLRMQTDRLKGISEENAKCMFFGEYVDAVVEMHEDGRERELNTHWRPQQLACPPPEPKGSVPTYISTIREIDGFLRGLRNFGFKTSGTALTVLQTHTTSVKLRRSYSKSFPPDLSELV